FDVLRYPSPHFSRAVVLSKTGVPPVHWRDACFALVRPELDSKRRILDDLRGVRIGRGGAVSGPSFRTPKGSQRLAQGRAAHPGLDRKSTRLNSSHGS